VFKAFSDDAQTGAVPHCDVRGEILEPLQNADAAIGRLQRD
jgi:hypothetical protein